MFAFTYLGERSPLAKAAAGKPAVVDHTTRGFKSLPSPPPLLCPAYKHVERMVVNYGVGDLE